MATDSKKTTTVLRSILLAVLLVASVAAAAGYIILREKDSGEVIAEIRSRGLSALRPAQSTQYWYRRTRREAEAVFLIGWQVVTYTADAGGFHGTRIEYSLPDNGIWERWTLNQDATECLYYAGEFAGDAGSWVIRLTTASHFADGRLTVVQRIGPEVVLSSADAPSNYLPEGTIDLAARLMLERRGRATFCTVLNDVLPKEGEPKFWTLSLGRMSRNDAPDGTTVVRSRRSTPLGDGGNLLFFGKDQMLVRRMSGSYEDVLITQAEREQLPPQTIAVYTAIDGASLETIQLSIEEDRTWRLMPPDGAAE